MNPKILIAVIVAVVVLCAAAGTTIGVVLGTRSKGGDKEVSTTSAVVTSSPPQTTTLASTTALPTTSPQSTPPFSSTTPPATIFTPTPTVTTSVPADTTTTPSPTTTMPPLTTTSAPTTTAAPVTVSLGLRTLLITTAAASPSLAYAKKVLYSRGAPYTMFNVSSGESLDLVDGSGKPLYSGILVCTASSADYNATYRDLVRAYEEAYGVPEVEVFATPSAATKTTSSGVVSGTAPKVWLSAYAAPYAKALNSSATPLMNANTKRYRASITDSATTVPVVYAYDDVGGQSVLAALTTFNTANTAVSHQRMSLFFDGVYESSSFAHWWLAHVWFNFLQMNGGLYLGLTRVYLAPHIDDVFLSDDTYNPITHTVDTSAQTRMDADDVARFVYLAKTKLPSLMPGASDVAFDLWLNGIGAFGDASMGFDPYDSGELFNAFNNSFEDFIWGSHTWSHPNLDSYTAAQTQAELEKNTDFIKTQMVGSSTNRDARYIKDVIVTPQISGLLAAEPLSAILAHGVWAAAGDISREEITNPDRYRGMWVSSSTHPALGKLLIVPRGWTHLYYFCYNDTCTREYYWELDGKPAQKLSFEKILDVDAERVLECIVRLDWQPWMFHQPNVQLFTYAGETVSLLELWLKRVVGSYRQYFTLPLLNSGFSDLAKQYRSRENRDACTFDASVTVTISDANRTVSNVHVVNPCTEAAKLTIPLDWVPASALSSGTVYGPMFVRTIDAGAMVDVPVQFQLRNSYSVSPPVASSCAVTAINRQTGFAGTSFTLTGTGFGDLGSVLWGTELCTVTFWNSTVVRGYVPDTAAAETSANIRVMSSANELCGGSFEFNITSPEITPTSAMTLAFNFMRDNMRSATGGVYTNYQEDISSVILYLYGHHATSEHVGLMLWTAAAMLDHAVYEQTYQFVQSYMLSPRVGILNWGVNLTTNMPYKDADGMQYNAPLDDFRVLRGLIAGWMHWHDERYHDLAVSAGAAMLTSGRSITLSSDYPDYPNGLVTNGFAFIEEDATSDATSTWVIPIDYCDLYTMKWLAQEGVTGWSPVVSQSISLIQSAQHATSKQFYNSILQTSPTVFRGDWEHQGSWGDAQRAVRIKTMQSLWTAIHMARVGKITEAQAALAFYITKYTADGFISDYYEPNGDAVTPASAIPDQLINGETRIYALATRLSYLLGNTTFGDQLISEKILPAQDTDASSATYGTIDDSHTHGVDTESYNPLEALLALAYQQGSSVVDMKLP